MPVNKVVYDDKTLIDLTGDTVTPAKMLSGTTAHDKSGAVVTGTIPIKTSSNLSASGATVSVPAGYYASDASKSVATGEATTPATTITENPSIWINSAGKITASVSGTKSVTPTVSEGYVSSGTEGTITVNGYATKQLATWPARTITPSTSSQIAVPAGYYTTGDITVEAIPDYFVNPAASAENMVYTPTTKNLTIPARTYFKNAGTIVGDADLIAANIKRGVDIFGVTGTYTLDATATAAHIAKGKTAYANGVKLTGTAKTYEEGVNDGYADAMDQLNAEMVDWSVVTSSSGCTVKIINYHSLLAVEVSLTVTETLETGNTYGAQFWVGPDSTYTWRSGDGDLGESIIDGYWEVDVEIIRMVEA